MNEETSAEKSEKKSEAASAEIADATALETAEKFVAGLPEKFVRVTTEANGDQGWRWLYSLPSRIEKAEREWEIEIHAPFPTLSYHFVAPCTLKNGGAAVVKFCYSGDETPPIFNEASMLRLYNGGGTVEYLRYTDLCLMIELVTPGENLFEVFRDAPEKAVDTACDVLKKLGRRSALEFDFYVKLDDWFAGLEKVHKTEFPAAPAERALSYYRDLSTSGEKFLLHGDFHHENILSAMREPFLAIDPKGIVGNFGYEFSVFLNNHVWWLEKRADLPEQLDSAVDKFAESFAIPREELKKWAYAQAVLSAWWTFEENGENWKHDLALADVWEV